MNPICRLCEVFPSLPCSASGSPLLRSDAGPGLAIDPAHKKAPPTNFVAGPWWLSVPRGATRRKRGRLHQRVDRGRYDRLGGHVMVK